MKQAIRKFVVGTLAMLMLTGCVFNDEVGTNQMAVRLYKNNIEQVVGPGVYTQWFCFWCDLKSMDIDTLTFPVEDAEVLTKDNQAVSVKITIQARRKADDVAVKNIFTNWSTLTVNEQLINTISATAREGMKVGTRKFTLTDLLDERSDVSEVAGENTKLGLAGEIRKAIEEDAAKYSVEIINVTVENIGPSAEYMGILGQTANLNAEIDKSKREQELIKQKALNNILEQESRVTVAQAQLEAERAETEVQVEIAERAGEIITASNQVYTDNPQAFELERLRLLKDVLGDKVMFLPSDAVLTLLQGAGGVLPLPAVVAPETGGQ